MKKRIIVSALIFCAVHTFAQKNPFEKFSDMDGVTSVYISKNMLSMLPKSSKMEYNGVNVGGFIDKLSSILILTSENAKIGSEMISLANKQVKGDNYELLMHVKSGDNQKVNFFMRGKPENIQELMMIVDGGKDDDYVIMQLFGNFSMQDMEQITKG
ncbi:MAG: DUF4252 domain-containing protein, partial [Dysgonamonadaceae bacterium]|nr:DUF4252 domain-containing protein [Dysgonamonadaceae bacterium]